MPASQATAVEWLLKVGAGGPGGAAEPTGGVPLLSYGVTPQQLSPLHVAAMSGQAAVAQLLLESGGSVGGVCMTLLP
jgi:hypothetical protein